MLTHLRESKTFSPTVRFALQLPLYLFLILNSTAHAISPSPCIPPLLGRITSQTAIEALNKETLTDIIIAGYSSGRFLPKKLKTQLVHFHPGGKPTDDWLISSFNPQDYTLDVIEDLSAAEIVKFILSLGIKNIRSVIVGSEDGVAMGIQVAKLLKEHYPNIPIIGKDPGIADKVTQYELIAKAGLPHAPFAGVTTADQAEEFLTRSKVLEKPPFKVFVKPTNAAGSHGGKTCDTVSCVRNHTAELMVSTNEVGIPIPKVAVMGFVGNSPKLGEYAVQSVGGYGHVVVTDVLEYERKQVSSGKWVSHKMRIMDPNDPNPHKRAIVLSAVKYNKQSRQSLGAINFAGHNEMKINPYNSTLENPEFNLIEFNYRFAGNSLTEFIRLLFGDGYNQIDRTVLMLDDPKAFMALPEMYTLKRHGGSFTIKNLANYPRKMNQQVLLRLMALPGYIGTSVKPDANRIYAPTEDLLSTYGSLWFTGTPQEIEDYLNLCEELEEKGLFLEP